MGWSVGYRLPYESDLIDEILLANGKSLYLANRFEGNCRYVLRVAKFADAIKADPVLSLEEVAAALSADKMLGPTLRELSSRADIAISPEQVAMLGQARNARNYVAHESATALGEIYSRDVQNMINSLRELRSRVRQLAAGDNLVATWVFQIEEPREPLPSVHRAYLELIDDWIFGHMPSNWLDVNWQCEYRPPRGVKAALGLGPYKAWYSRDDEQLHDAESAQRRHQIERRTLLGEG